MTTAQLHGYDELSFKYPTVIRDITYTGNYADLSGDYLLSFFTNVPEYLMYMVYDNNHLPNYIFYKGSLYSTIVNGTALEIDLFKFYPIVSQPMTS
jgi:hypothetical protein